MKGKGRRRGTSRGGSKGHVSRSKDTCHMHAKETDSPFSCSVSQFLFRSPCPHPVALAVSLSLYLSFFLSLSRGAGGKRLRGRLEDIRA